MSIRLGELFACTEQGGAFVADATYETFASIGTRMLKPEQL